MGIGPRMIEYGRLDGYWDNTRMIQLEGTGGRRVENGCKVVLVTRWPKEETWDGEVRERHLYI